MHIKKLAPIIGGIALAIITVLLLIPTSDIVVSSVDFAYDSNFELKEQMQEHEIAMSNPIQIQGESINEHCNFFKDSSIQSKVEYCTSTELKDSEGNFLGNIHMVGNSKNPQLAMAIIQTDPFLSESPELVLVFQTMIQTLVCDCWEEKKPGGLKSIPAWIQASYEHHLEAKKTTSKSEITGLAQKEIVLEITTNTDGYLWKLLVDK